MIETPVDWNGEFEDGTKPKWLAAFGVGLGLVAAGLLGATILAVGIGGGLGASSRSSGSNAVTLLEGERIYTARCAACHGVGGEGGIGLPLGNGAVVEKYPAISRQVSVITNGRNAMPAFGNVLTAEQIVAVATYERDQLGRSDEVP